MPRRVLTHPVVWSVPVMALLVWLFMPLNGEFYEFWVNDDPLGDAQQHEWARTTRIFRHTSGVLGGQLLALLAGVALVRRHRQAVALAVAVPLGLLLAGVTVLVAYPLAAAREAGARLGPAFDDPVLVRAILAELAGYPLFAAAGVGLGMVLAGCRSGRRGALLVLLGISWFGAAQVGLAQDDGFAGPSWLLWVVPPVAAGAAVALAGLSLDVWSDPPVPVGDRRRRRRRRSGTEPPGSG